MNNNKRLWFRKGSMILFCIIAGVFVFSFIVMHLWNAILPSVIHVSAITFWQALGILVLSKILFGGFGGRRWGGRRHNMMRDKFVNMTSEEREKFRSEWRSRCSRWGRKDEPKENAAESI
jgi:hypothetical protein